MHAIVDSPNTLTFGGRTYTAAIGRGGRRSDKREGDGATPLGLLVLRHILFRPDRLAAPQAAVPVQALTPTDGWCDDPAHTAYNRMVTLPIAARAETLWRDDTVYDIIGALGWNDDPIIPGRGSAIFLHLARADYSPTEGCVALSLPDLQAVLAGGLTGILVKA